MSHDKIMQLLQEEIDAAELGRVPSLKLIQQHMEFMSAKLDEYSVGYVKLNKKYYRLRNAVLEGLKNDVS